MVANRPRKRFLAVMTAICLLHLLCAGFVTAYVANGEHDLGEGGAKPPFFAAAKMTMYVLLAPILPLVLWRSPATLFAFPLNSILWGWAAAWLWTRARTSRLPRES